MTTLGSSLSIASSSLSATQYQLSLTAGNIANADTEGYTVKSASQSSKSLSGTGAGVSVDTVTSKVSQYLLSDLMGATSDTAYALTNESYLSALSSSLGTLSDESGDGSALANNIAAFEEALTDLAATPESTSLANAAVTALEDTVLQINATASDIADAIEQAESEIQTSVDAANSLIETIQSINETITKTASQGQSTADLEDQLNQALVDLSEYLDIRTFKNDDGSAKVYTASGQILAGTQAHLLTTGVDAEGQTTISVNGSDITAKLDNGTLGALLTLRDETLPAYATTLDDLATGLMDSLNAVQSGLLTGTSALDLSIEDSFLSDPTTLLGTSDLEVTAFALLDAMQGETDFTSASGLITGTMTLADFASEFLSEIVTDTNRAESQLELAQQDLSTSEDTMSSLYGVNVDEETERLAELQQLYALASTLLSVIQDMFDDLRSAVS